jgi:transcription elongation factor Elf1
LGADTTTVSVYYKGILRHLSVIPLGGGNVTKDLTCLQIEEPDAEKMKLKYAKAYTDINNIDPTLNYPIDKDRVVESKKFIEIVEARVEEIVENAWFQIPVEFSDKLLGGIILTGGGSNMPEIDKVFKTHTHIDKVRIAKFVSQTVNSKDPKITNHDGQTTQKCPHGHDLKSIIERMGRKKYGSKAFKRCQSQRTNYINYSINRLNLNNASELRLEKLHQMRSGKRTSSVLNRWTYTQINAQIISRCEELGVPVKEQSSVYRSQRCSRCGWTQKSNRKGKEFICKSCGEKHDADINGALNHEADLYQLPFGFYKLSLNRSGFFWTTDGAYDEFGQVLTVPDVQNTK